MEIAKMDLAQKDKIVNEQFNVLFAPTKAKSEDNLGLILEFRARLSTIYDVIFEAGYRQREGEETLKSVNE